MARTSALMSGKTWGHLTAPMSVLMSERQMEPRSALTWASKSAWRTAQTMAQMSGKTWGHLTAQPLVLKSERQ